jgi:hypothetical protein
MSASAMMGGALICFRTGMTDLLRKETSFTRRMTGLFLAYQMPECQVTRLFSTSTWFHALTTLLLAYQMP